MERVAVDHLLVRAERLLTMDPARGSGDLGVVRDGAVAVRGERIVAAGATDEILARHAAPADAVLDLAGQTLLPGYVDPHTHVLFAGSREEEFARRLDGASYMEIAAAGGGILSSVRAFRSSSDEEILTATRRRCDRMLALGSTTIEAKSGYGLDTESEMRALRLIDALDASHPLSLLGTFLGAHEIAPEYRDRRSEYVRLVAEEMLPRAARETKVRFCDVFCEKGVFTAEESRTILRAAQQHGLGLRLHADEFAPSGAAELAGELGALSADHLMEVTDAGLAAMRSAGTIAILLPATSFSMANRRYAPARRILDEGIAVALATDCNPGSAMTTSMPLVVTLAVLEMKMTVAEALAAATRNAAAALGLPGEVGRLADGFRADLQILPTHHEAGIVYHLGGLIPSRVMKSGRWVAKDGILLSQPPRPSS